MTDYAELEKRLRQEARDTENHYTTRELAAEAADAVAALARQLEEAKKGVARWKSVVRAARAQSGKWGEQARWQLPDPDWRSRTEEELARLRAVDEPEPSDLSTDQAPAVTGQGEK